MFTFPSTTTAKQLQQNYRRVFDLAKKTQKPVFVMRNNKPDVAIIDAKQLEKMEAIISILRSKEDYKKGKTKILKGTLLDLWHEAQKNNN